MKKRMLAILMSLVMLVGLMPVTAMAAESVADETTLRTAIENAAAGTTIDVTGEITLSETLVIDGKEIILQGGGKIKAADNFTVASDSMIVLKNAADVTVQNITLDANHKARVLNAGGGSTLTVDKDAWITGGGDSEKTNKLSGGGIYVTWNEAANIFIKGGKISGNTVQKNGAGGGIHIGNNAATVFEMTGGEISGNTGGGVCLYSYQVTSEGVPVGRKVMTGGTVTENTGYGVSLINNDLVIGGNVKIANNDTKGRNINLHMQSGDSYTFAIKSALKKDIVIFTNYSAVGNDIATAADGYTIKETDLAHLSVLGTDNSGNELKYGLKLVDNKIVAAAANIVTFKANDGTDASEMQKVLTGEATNLRTNSFSREDYGFLYWTTGEDGSGTKYVDGASLKATADITLYAQWMEKALSGTCGATANDDVRWELKQNNEGGTNPTYTLEITGNGKMADWKYVAGAIRTAVVDSPWYPYAEMITRVEIGDGVILGDRAFQGMKALETVKLPAGITNIPTYCFADCVKLKNMVIPETVTNIEGVAFRACDSFTAITLPASATIGDNLFIGCKNLKSVSLPDDLTSLPLGTFSQCPALKTVNLPEGITSIGQNAFLSCTGLETIGIPSGVTSIGKSAFDGCSKLTVLDLSKTKITAVSESMLKNVVGLEKVFLPNTVTTLGANAFSGCSNLSHIVLYADPLKPINAEESGTGGTYWSERIPTTCFAGLNGKCIVYFIGEEMPLAFTGSYLESRLNSNRGFAALLNGGTVSAGSSFKAGEFAEPELNGKVFAGWFDNEGCTGTAVTEPVDGTTTYYAKWTDCGITFDGNGATSGEMAVQYADVNDTLRPNAFVRSDGNTDYTFAGWTLTENGSGTVYADGAEIKDDLKGEKTLYAKWTKVITDANNPSAVGDTYFVESATTNKVYTGEVITLDTTDVVVYKNDAKITEGYTVDATSDSDTGTYTVAVKVGDVEIGTVTCKITPATLTARYVSEVIRVGRTPALFVEVTGFVNGETADTAKGYTAPAVTTDKTEIGTYTLTPSGGAAGNYTFAYESGTLTIKGRSGGSSSAGNSSAAAKNEVSTDTSANGSIELNTDEAKKGDTVTFTVKPEEGYEVGEVTVTDENGKEIKVTDNGDGTYSFTMPDSEVEIEATFEEVKEEAPAKEGVAQESISLTIGSTVATVDGMPVVNDVAPIIRGERTMLPIRFVAEALGAEVSWNEAEAKVTITKGDLVIEIYIGQPFALVNGEPVQLDEPAFIENDRTYLPLRFVAEALGATVLWDGNTNTVTIIPEK